jgi:hypothetical protein
MTRIAIRVGTLVLVVTASTSAWNPRGRPRAGKRDSAPACQSQFASPPDVAVSPSDMINGAKHPELVPDSVAYRLFFLNVAEPADATADQKSRQRAYLRAAGLREEEVQPAAAVLADFKSQYDDMVGRYNESVDLANEAGTSPDLVSFRLQLGQLVESTKQGLETAVRPESARRFEAHVRLEKRNMRVAKEDR